MIQAWTLHRFCIAMIHSLVLLFISTSPIHAQGKAHASDPFVADRVLVSFQPGTAAQDMQTAHGQAGGRVLKTLSGIGVQVIAVPEGRVRAAIAAYQRNPNVKFAEPNYRRKLYLPSTSEGGIPSMNVANIFAEQWGLHNTGQSFGATLDPLMLSLIAPAYRGVADADMDVPEGWAISHGSSAIKIAILDSGVSCQHADLNDKCLETLNFVADQGSPDQDLVGHGTHVAGIAAAKTDNGIGVAGVAREAMVGSMKVCYEDLLLIDFGIIQAYCDDADIAAAIEYAADHDYHIINMSLAGPSPSSTLQSAVNYAWNAGLVLVAGAGNDYGTAKQYPAAFANVMAVAATDYYDNLASFSTFSIDSDDWVSVAAPGHVILSTVPGELCGIPADDPEGCYDWKSGTSMATPMVAGVVAVVWGANPTLNNAQIRDLVQNSADAEGALGQNFLSWTQFGRVNLHAALSAQAGGGTPVGGDTDPPVISSVTAERLNGTRFRITWQTNEPSTSSITFAGGDAYTDSILTTNHSMSFRGSKGTTYVYEVGAADGVGNDITVGPFEYTND
jgi:thermitase